MQQHKSPARSAGREASLHQKELQEALALAIASFASDVGEGEMARAACRRIESAVLASNAGPLGLSLLETLDARLREALGDHDLFEGRYA